MAPRQRTFASRQATDYEPSESSTLVPKGVPPKQSSMLNQTEADIARDWHDYFNLVALVFIIATTVLNYDFDVFSLKISWTGDYFWLNWVTTLVYFFVDLVWVAMVPICVKSPGVIIKHHIVAMLYLTAPVYWPEYRWFMGSILSVEVNTWFLIMRRVVFKTASPVPPMVANFVSAMFYLTWILIRCIIYPGVLVTFFGLAAERIEASGTYFHWPMLCIPAHAALCVLNLKWTYDLFEPIVKKWSGKGPRTVVVQNGL